MLERYCKRVTDDEFIDDFHFLFAHPDLNFSKINMSCYIVKKLKMRVILPTQISKYWLPY